MTIERIVLSRHCSFVWHRDIDNSLHYQRHLRPVGHCYTDRSGQFDPCQWLHSIGVHMNSVGLRAFTKSTWRTAQGLASVQIASGVTMTANGAYLWSGGSIAGGGTVTFSSSSSLLISGAVTLSLTTVSIAGHTKVTLPEAFARR